jgi:NAD(P)-dependent dehydrogenase (short-subunit alcohol dehydrogenase family)
MSYRASGLGRACVEDICRKGGYVAILDMNDELATELVKEMGAGKTKFFECNVLETDSIAAAVKGCLEWVKETGKAVGGVIAAAGVATPAKVGSFYSVCFFDLKSPISFNLTLLSFSSSRSKCFLEANRRSRGWESM